MTTTTRTPAPSAIELAAPPIHGRPLDTTAAPNKAHIVCVGPLRILFSYDRPVAFFRELPAGQVSDAMSRGYRLQRFPSRTTRQQVMDFLDLRRPLQAAAHETDEAHFQKYLAGALRSATAMLVL